MLPSKDANRKTGIVEGRCRGDRVVIFSFTVESMRQFCALLRDAAQKGEEIDVTVDACLLCIRYGSETGRADWFEGCLYFTTNRVDIAEIADILDEIADEFPVAPVTAFPHLHLEPPFLCGIGNVSDIVFEPVAKTDREED